MEPKNVIEILTRPCNQDLGRTGLVYELANWFAVNDPKFKAGKFLKACGINDKYVEKLLELESK